MSPDFISIDLPALTISALAGLCCSLLGSLLLFRKNTMMADTLSHSILPGLVIAYIISGTISAPAMFTGAFISCLIAASMVYIIQRFTVLDTGIAMGVTLATLFAAGLVMLELLIDGRVHLDAQHALYGALELTYWQQPYTWQTLPQTIKVLFGLAIMIVLTLTVFFNHIKIWLFDLNYAQTSGLPVHLFSGGLMFLTVCAAVACFEAVGVILVLALFICPAAGARMLTDNFKNQIILSAAFGVTSGLGGYWLGAILPLWLGFEHSINAAASIAVLAGLIQILAMLYAPAYGYFAKRKISDLNS